MKPYFSILMVATRTTFYKIAGILAAMMVAEFISFYRVLSQMPSDAPMSLEAVIQTARIPLVSGIGFLLICVVVSLTGVEGSGSKVRYTLQRLQVSEKGILFIWALYNIAVLLILWAVQVGGAWLMSHMYLNAVNPFYYNDQTVFLAFYRNPFLHSLLPLAEMSRLFRNLALILALGISAACFSYKQRRNQRGIAILVIMLMTFALFPGGIGHLASDLLIAIGALSIMAHTLFSVMTTGGKDESET